MAFIIKDRVKEGTSSVGTGVITLSGAVATFTTFNSFMTNGDTTYYAIVHTSSGVDEWEVGLGTWNTGNTLTRTTVLSGSNGTSAVTFSTGTKDVFMTYPASKAVVLDASVNLSIPGNLSVTGSVDGVTSIEVDTHLDFQTTTQNKPAHHEGRIFYDAAFGALAVYNDEADITLQVGQEEYIRVKNNTGSTILNGVPIYITGEESNTPTVAVARADGTYNQSQSVGIATHDIETNSIGYITVRGLIADVDTSHLTVGEKVHVAIGASGGTQTASPTYPNYPTEVGICLISSSSGGCIYVYTQTEAFESLRVTGNSHFDSDVTIAGDLTILGNQTIASASNVSIANAWNYFNSGDTIGSLNTAFTGSGLDDASLTGHFTGTSTTNYYVRIDSVGGGTGGVDTFEWSTDNFSTFVAQDVDITGSDQLIHSTDNIAIIFNATTGHTLGDVWTGSGSPINVDTGFASNRNTGTSGVGYTHVGIYYDVSTNKWTVFDEYSPEPEGTINVGHSSFSYGTLKAGVFEGSLTGNVTGDLTGNSAGQHNGAVLGNVTGNVSGTSGSTTGNAATATTLATARNIQLTGDVTGTASFNGSNNAVITASVQDDSHAHVISNVDGLQTALNSKAPTSRIITAGNGLTGGGSLTANRTLTVGGGTGVTVNANDIAIGQDVATTANPTFNNITVTGTVDGRDVSVDGTKLDGIEASADVTDTANVTAAGALMDSELTSIASVKALNQGVGTTNNPTFAGVISTAAITTSGGLTTGYGVSLTNGSTNFLLYNNPNEDVLYMRDTTNGAMITTWHVDKFGVDQDLEVTGNIALTGTVDGRDVATDGTKLDGIEAGAKADQVGLVKGTDIPSGANLNTYTTDGYFHQNGNSNAGSGSNYPVALAGMLSVQADGSMVYQKYQTYNGTGAYQRTYYNGSWFAWDKILDTGNSFIFTSADNTKLDGIATGATNTVTNATHTGEVTGSGALTVANNVIDAGNLKVTGNGTTSQFLRSDGDGTFTWATPTDTNTTYSVGDGGLTQKNFTSADNTKLDGIETGATADQTAAQLLTAIKTVDVNGTAGVNAGTLGGQLPSSAAGNNTIVQRHSSGYIYANYYNGTGTFATGGNASGMGIFTGTNGNDTFGRSYTAAAARTLLNVENGATADQTAAQILTAIKTVDGSGSGLDADLLDGLHASSFATSAQGTLATNALPKAGGTMTGNLTIPNQIIHAGDTDTYMQFHAANQWRVVTGGSQRLEVNNTQITSTEPIHAPSFHGDGSALTGIVASAGGAGNDEIFWENGQNVTTNYTVTNGKNAMSAGPITINSGVTVTVGAGETWTVI